MKLMSCKKPGQSFTPTSTPAGVAKQIPLEQSLVNFGMKPAFYRHYMAKLMTFRFVVEGAFFLMLSSGPAFAGGASEGGTNVVKASMELVEFERLGKIVKIDPKTFEGLYRDLKPRLKALEERIPNLGAALERVMKDKLWYVTTTSFNPRNSEELKPISQDKLGIFMSLGEIKRMSPEQLRRAFFHELVRGYVMREHNGEPDYERCFDCLTFSDDSMLDETVEKMTKFLYLGYLRTGKQIAEELNRITKKSRSQPLQSRTLKYMDRETLVSVINPRKLAEVHQAICQNDQFQQNGIFEKIDTSLISKLQSVNSNLLVMQAQIPFNAKLEFEESAAFQLLLSESGVNPKSKDFRERIALACNNLSKKTADFLKRIIIEEEASPETAITSISEAERLLDVMNRAPGAVAGTEESTKTIKPILARKDLSVSAVMPSSAPAN